MNKQITQPLLIIFLMGTVLFGACKKDNDTTNTAADKTALNSLIDSLNVVLNASVEGNKPGQYTEGSKAALDSVLQLAQL